MGLWSLHLLLCVFECDSCVCVLVMVCGWVMFEFLVFSFVCFFDLC